MHRDGGPDWQRAHFLRVSTDVAPASERFDFWHALFPGIELRHTVREHGYGAQALSCAGDDGIAFTDLSCAPTASRFFDGRLDHMQLCLVTEGQFGFTHGNDDRERLGPGPGLHLLDCHRPARTYSDARYRAFHISLPRALVHRTMGADPIGGRRSLRTLPDTPLGLLLKSQLQALSVYGPAMDAEETAAAMDAMSGLTLAYLNRFNPARADAEDGALDDALFAAACSYIDARKDRADLTAATIARAIGCSRAGLYRTFDRRGLAVADHVREVRLNHARRLLRETALDVGEVSLRCGYGDLSAFGKAFRRRFGMTPRDWRMSVV
ncbi:MAG TPA: helix-turn-helix transcriptional regulator [Sphingomonas sp.]|nr:helix-turn-helix transcriptional regulator [Sphingomonas sp.]